MRDLIFCISCKPKCDDRRRPPYFERSENAAPIRRSSGRPSMFDRIHFFLYYLDSMFRGKGGWVGMDCGEERSEAKGRPISTRRGEAAPYLASRASGAAIHSNVHVSLSAKIGDGRHI